MIPQKKQKKKLIIVSISKVILYSYYSYDRQTINLIYKRIINFFQYLMLYHSIYTVLRSIPLPGWINGINSIYRKPIVFKSEFSDKNQLL